MDHNLDPESVGGREGALLCYVGSFRILIASPDICVIIAQSCVITTAHPELLEEEGTFSWECVPNPDRS